jgi:hypothetical protein
MRRVLSLAVLGLLVASATGDGIAQSQQSDPSWTTEPFLDQFSKRPAPPPVASLPEAGAPRDVPIARIVDIMRVINIDDGIRGRLAKALAQPPRGDLEWERARSDAAIVAEAGNLLLAEPAPKGSPAGWRQRAGEFRASAEGLLRAVEAKDLATAQRELREMPATCAACHSEFR